MEFGATRFSKDLYMGNNQKWKAPIAICPKEIHVIFTKFPADCFAVKLWMALLNVEFNKFSPCLK